MNILHIEIELLYGLDDGKEALAEHITEIIRDNESEFSERMERVCRKYDLRAELLVESLYVQDVSLSNNGGVASVEYGYDAYSGCKDMRHSGEVEDTWDFELVGEKIIFNLELPELERYDEI